MRGRAKIESHSHRAVSSATMSDFWSGRLVFVAGLRGKDQNTRSEGI